MSLKATEDGMYLYENNYTLPLGFMIPNNVEPNWNYATETNPFLVQNNFAELSTGTKEIFTPLAINSNTFTTTKDGYVFIKIGNTSCKNRQSSCPCGSD
jgi:hypothetical protein